MKVRAVRQLKVKRGDLITPAWNRLVDFADSLRLFSGPGILLSPRIGGGVTISARSSARSFDHPWRATLTGEEVAFEPGRVNGLEPLIGGEPMSGKDNNPRPKLQLTESLFTAAGESWLCLELTRNGAKIAGLRMVQTAKLDAGGDMKFADGGSPEIRPNVALEPVAMLYRGNERTGLGEIRQIRFFNVTQWRVNLDNPGGPRHFFA